jgi:methionyl-tRNA formyltransferase
MGAIVAQDLFALTTDETHDTLLAKCQMAAKRLSADLAANLPRLWADAQPQGAGSYWPRVSERQRTLDWTRNVSDVLRTVRAFGSIEAMAQIGGKRIYVWDAAGWTASHRHAPGTLVHKHRRHLVIAVRDGFVQITGWSALAPESAREAGR